MEEIKVGIIRKGTHYTKCYQENYRQELGYCILETGNPCIKESNANCPNYGLSVECRGDNMPKYYRNVNKENHKKGELDIYGVL